MYPQHLHPDDYQRLRDEAKRHALQLRQDAIREAHTWVARGFLRMVRRAFHLARTEAAPMNPSTLEPVQDLFVVAQVPCRDGMQGAVRSQ